MALTNFDASFGADVGDSIRQLTDMEVALASVGATIDLTAKLTRQTNLANKEWTQTVRGMTVDGKEFVAVLKETAAGMEVEALKMSKTTNVAKANAAAQKNLSAIAQKVAQDALNAAGSQKTLADMTTKQTAKLQGLVQTVERTVKRSGLSVQEIDAVFQNFANGGMAVFTGKAGEIDRSLRRMQVGFKELEDEVNGSGKSMWLTWENVSKFLQIEGIHQLFISTIALAKEGAVEYTKFQQSVALIQTITEDVTASTYTWEVALRKTSDAFNIPLLQTASATYDAISNQVIRGTEAMSFMGTAAKFAKVTNSELSASVNILSSVINAYGISSGNADDIAAELFKTIDLGRLNTDQLNTSLGNQLAVAAKLGISYQEVLASLSVITQQGVGTDVALTNLGSVMTKLLKPTKALDAYFKELGYASGIQFVKGVGGLTGALEKLNAVADKEGFEEIAAAFKDIRGTRFLFATLGDRQLELYLKNLKLIQNSTDQFEKAYANTVANLGESWSRTTNRINNILITDFGQGLLKSFSAIENGIFSMEASWRKFAAVFETGVNVFRGVIAPINATTNSIAAFIGVTNESQTAAQLSGYALIGLGVTMFTTSKYAVYITNQIRAATVALYQYAVASATAGKLPVISGGFLAGVGITAAIIGIDQLVRLYDQASDVAGNWRASQLKLNEALSEGFKEIDRRIKPIGESLDQVISKSAALTAEITQKFGTDIRRLFGEVAFEFEGLLGVTQEFRDLMKSEFDPDERMKDMKKELQDSVKATDDLNKNFGTFALKKFFLDKEDLQATIELTNDFKEAAFTAFEDGDIKAFRDYSNEALASWKEIEKTVRKTIETDKERLLKIKEERLGTNFNLADSQKAIADLRSKANTAIAANNFNEAEKYLESISRIIEKISSNEKKLSNGKNIFTDKLKEENITEMEALINKRLAFNEARLVNEIQLGKEIDKRRQLELMISEQKQQQFITAEKLRQNQVADTKLLKDQENAAEALKARIEGTKQALTETDKAFSSNIPLLAGKRIDARVANADPRSRSSSENVNKTGAVFFQNLEGLVVGDSLKQAETAFGKKDYTAAIDALLTQFNNTSLTEGDLRKEFLKTQKATGDERVNVFTKEQQERLKAFTDVKILLVETIKLIQTRKDLEQKLKEQENDPNLKRLIDQSPDTISALDKNRKAIEDNTLAIRGKGPQQAFADGGWVSGPGGIDVIPARLTAGEFVMPTGPAAQFAPILESMRSGSYRPSAANSYVSTIGDIHVTVQGGQSTEQTAREVARLIQRDIVRGNSRFQRS